MSGRPFLSIFHEASNANEILRRAGGGIALSFAGVEGLPAIEAPVANAITRIATAGEGFERADPAAYAPYTAAAIARQYASIFNRLTTQEKIAA